MTEFKTLGEMKIRNPLEIDRYSVQTIERPDEQVDVLRIVYKRNKGSLLPKSKRFRFQRIKKKPVKESGPGKMGARWEVSPFLRKAVAELDQIFSAEYNKKEKIKIILDEVRRLEEDSKIRLDYIRGLVDSI
ncbi:MAG: DUF3461 family protein [Thermodesulfobacteriota bacterium]